MSIPRNADSKNFKRLCRCTCTKEKTLALFLEHLNPLSTNQVPTNSVTSTRWLIVTASQVAPKTGRNLFDYEVECSLISKRSGQLVATGLGSCNSFEGKYRWREQQRKCPTCGKEAIIKGKAEYGGGFLCWKKKDGCGAKFEEDDDAITGQPAGKVQNEDIPTLKNTILKMAKKRAKVDAVLSATRSSGLFTQDIEDWSSSPDESEGSKQEAKLVADKKLREAAKGQEGVKLVKWKDGLIAIQGNGLAIVRANMTKGEQARFQFKHDDQGKCWTLPIADAFPFSDLCKKYKVEAEFAE